MKRTYRDTRFFHHQVRIGKAGKPIVVSKLRTMSRGAQAEFEKRETAKRDPRVTRIGRILRRTRIDELPQLLNVLKGELRLVGPRIRLRTCYQRLPPEAKAIYREIGPGAWPIEYACREFPPSREELIRTYREFEQMWGKSPRKAQAVFFWRSLKNIWRGGSIDRKLLEK